MTRRRAAAVAGIVAGLLLVWWFWPRGSAPMPISVPSAETRAKVQPTPTRSTHAVAPGEASSAVEGAERGVEEAGESAPEGWAPPYTAHCRLEPALAAGAGHLVVGDPDEIPYDGRLVSVADGVARLPFVEDADEGWLAIEGYAPVAVRWSGGADGVPARCSPNPVVLEPGTAWITGHVTHAAGEPEGRVFVEGCGNQARTDEEGHYAMTVRPGTCVLGAFRRDGLLVAQAQAAEVHPRSGDELVVDFELPALPRAGLGIQISADGDGIRILGVLPGTAAEEIGLEAGDRVLEVDGTPTHGLALEEFVELAIGPVGSDVDITVERSDGVVERLTLDRRELSAPG